MPIITGHPSVPLDMENFIYGGTTGGTATVLTSTQIGLMGDNGATYLANGTGIAHTNNGGVITFTGGTITSVTVNAVMTITGFSMPVNQFLTVIASDSFTFLSIFLGGNDTINGTTHNDVLFGYTGNDTINAGDGNDTILADAGDDTINGGNGNDIFFAVEHDGNDTFNGGSGSDLLNFEGHSSGITLNLSLTTPQNIGWNLGIDTLNSIENIIGTNFEDIFIGAANTQSINAGAGNDTFHLQNTGAVTIRGGGGDDIFHLGGTLTAADVIDGDFLHFGGHEGVDILYLDGDYSSFRNLSSSVFGIESILLAGGNSYNLEFGQWGSLKATIDGSALDASHSLRVCPGTSPRITEFS